MGDTTPVVAEPNDEQVDARAGLRAGPHEVQRAAIAVYGLLTMLGVLEAASFEGPNGAPVDLHVLIMILFSTSIAIAFAHAWSSVVANRLVEQRMLNRQTVILELRFAGSFLAPTLISVVVILVSYSVRDVATSIDYAQAALVLVLFCVGLVGARRSGLSWARALAWGGTDVAVAIVIVALKEVESLLIH